LYRQVGFSSYSIKLKERERRSWAGSLRIERFS